MTIILSLSLLLNLILVIVCVRFGRKLLLFDSLYDEIGEDIDTHVNYLEELGKKSLVVFSPEVLALHTNLKIMREHFTEMGKAVNESKMPKRDERKLTENPPIE